jgi:hypothetical protein
VAGEDGFYLMHRGWQDHPVFRGEAFSKRDAFVWMIEEAAYLQRRVAMPSGEVTLDRGQLGHSYRFMAKAWKWEESKVRRFIASLQKAEIIDAATAAGQTVISICNYDKYQARPEYGTAPAAAAAPQDRRGGTANDKEGNQGNKLDGVAGGPVKPEPVDPFGPIGKLTNRCAQAAGVIVFPDTKGFADVLAIVRGWVDLGLDPDTEIIPALEADARGEGPPRHSLRYFNPTMAKLAAQKAAPRDKSRRSETHVSPLVRAALRSQAARDDR